MSDSTFLTRVELYNYKSIAYCDVELGPLMFLVGPNGAGKSNFLDALRFVSDALNNSLDHAMRERGGFHEVLRRWENERPSLSIRLHFRLPTGASGYYFLHIGWYMDYKYQLQTEECHFASGDDGTPETYYRVKDGNVESSEGIMPAASSDRLYLVAASGIPAFRPVYDALAGMAFYNLNPESLRVPQKPANDEVLSRNGDNIVSVFARMEKQSPEREQRIVDYLAAVVPGIRHVNARPLGDYETLQFHQRTFNRVFANSFPPSSMSDGTLRTFGILVALFQTGDIGKSPISLVGIEEPETALHPAAIGALLDAMSEASESKQVLVTSHSADLLDRKYLTADMLLAVVAEEGVTKIGPIDQASRSVMRDHLFTAGELLRINQLAPARNGIENKETNAGRLTEESAA